MFYALDFTYELCTMIMNWYEILCIFYERMKLWFKDDFKLSIYDLWKFFSQFERKSWFLMLKKVILYMNKVMKSWFFKKLLLYDFIIWIGIAIIPFLILYFDNWLYLIPLGFNLAQRGL